MAFNSSQISQPENADRIAEWLMNQVDVVLNSAVARPIEQLAEALSPLIIIGLTIQFLFLHHAYYARPWKHDRH